MPASTPTPLEAEGCSRADVVDQKDLGVRESFEDNAAREDALSRGGRGPPASTTPNVLYPAAICLEELLENRGPAFDRRSLPNSRAMRRKRFSSMPLARIKPARSTLRIFSVTLWEGHRRCAPVFVDQYPHDGKQSVGPRRAGWAATDRRLKR